MVKTVMSKVDGDQERRTGSSSYVESFKQNPSSSSPTAVHHAINEPRPSPIRAVSTTHNGNKPRVEADHEELPPLPPPDNRGIVDVEILDQDVPPLPPMGNSPIEKPVLSPDESRNMEEEAPPDPEVQRQRQARRGPTPPSPPQQQRSSPVALKTGMKRNRDAYEDGQIEDNDMESNGREEEGPIPGGGGGPIHSNLGEPIVHSDTAEEEVVVMMEREQKNENNNNNNNTMMKTRQQHKGKKVSTDGRQQQQQQQQQMIMEMSAAAAATAVKDAHPKAVGRWTYYSHYRDSGVPAKPCCAAAASGGGGGGGCSQPSTSKAVPPSPPAPRLAKKLGINHMDLLYKTEKEVMICRICLSVFFFFSNFFFFAPKDWTDLFFFFKKNKDRWNKTRMHPRLNEGKRKRTRKSFL